MPPVERLSKKPTPLGKPEDMLTWTRLYGRDRVSTMANRKAPRDRQEPEPESEAWNKLPWRKLEQHAYRIQKRIYRANQHGETRKVQKLQKLLMKSAAAQLLAVRRVTQDNQGKKTAGVDGVKSVKPTQRLAMAKAIHPKHWKHQRSKPVRRIWIPKPGKAEQRPLGIPTMFERSRQALAKMALEPEWEAVFESNSYGFRPGRRAHDAIEAIFEHIRHKPKYVFDADIKGCFDHIDQTALLTKLHTHTALRHAIKAWLKAGVLEGVEFTPTDMGTPQGGVISPLLANIALHGMEEVAANVYPKTRGKPVLIRYADDFLILHPEKEVLEKAAKAVENWLGNMGLFLNLKKTRITHTLTPYEGNVGFEFLGFTIRQFPCGNTHTGKNPHGKPLGFKTIIRPSDEAIKLHLLKIGRLVRKMRGAAQEALIRDLNPVIRGWTNYYRTVISSQVFTACDNTLFYQLKSWSEWRHHGKGKGWITQKYWRTIEGRKTFAVSDEFQLRLHSQTHIIRPYAKVKGNSSPYDGNLLYWSQRLKNHPLLRKTLAKLLQKQKGKCRWCELYFHDGDQIEIDPITPKSEGGGEELSNKFALHLHCHDERHAKRAETEKRSEYADAGVNTK